MHYFTPKSLMTIILASGILLFSSSCKKKEGCMDPDAANFDKEATENCCCLYYETVKLEFDFNIDGQDFNYDEEYSAVANRPYDFKFVQFYISRVTLHGPGGDVELEDSYYLVNPDKPVHLAVEKELEGSYSSISFNVGVDEETNNTKQPSDFDSDHPLAPQDELMWWSWNSGYIFFKIEGDVDTTSNPDNVMDAEFRYHVGTNDLLRKVELNKSISVGDGAVETIQISVDPSQFFNDVDLAKERKSHTTDNMPLATKVADNVPLVFSIK